MKSRRELMAGAAGLGAGLFLATASKARTTLIVSVSPTWISGTGSGGVSDPATTTASGGVPPYSYSWARGSGSSSIIATDPTSDVTSFQWIGPWSGPSRLSGWICTVTDAANNTATHFPIQVEFDPEA